MTFSVGFLSYKLNITLRDKGSFSKHLEIIIILVFKIMLNEFLLSVSYVNLITLN